MKKLEGTILRLGEKDRRNRIFSEDCVVRFPEKIPVSIDFRKGPENIIGHCMPKIDYDKKEITCDAFIREDAMNDLPSEINVGGYYTNVELHKEDDCEVIDKCFLQGSSVVFAPAIDGQILKKKEEEE